nr:FtsX-like permease family protein [Evansella caseinilytica]
MMKSEVGIIGEFSLFIQAIGFTLLFITLTVAIISILLNTLASISERKNEIGVMKAVGYRNADIIKLFLLENTVVSAISLLLSVTVSSLLFLGMRLIVTHFFSIHLQGLVIHGSDVVNSIFVSFIIVLIIPVFTMLLSMNKLFAIDATHLTKE